jgi:hypothetical protein
MAEWSRLVNTTISNYVRGEETNILRNRKLLDLLRGKGRITFNWSGTSFVKRIRYKRAPLVGYADGDTLTFSRRDRWRTFEQDWRGYSATDAMTKKERLENKGTEAIIKIYSDLGESLMDDINDQFGDEFYIDGNAAGKTKRIHGVESFFGNGGAAAAGYIGSPSDTYGGLSTALGNYGGSWSTTGGNSEWPTGTGDAHYDFFSPLIVDYTDTAWAASTKTWPNTCVEAMRFAIVKSAKNKSKKGMLDLILLNDELYRQYLNARDNTGTSTVQRVIVEKGSNSADGKIGMGFGDVTNFDGVDVTFEYGMPTGLGYGFNCDQMELMSLQAQLFVVDGPEYDIQTKTWRTSIDFFGNLWCNPRFQVKFMNLT